MIPETTDKDKASQLEDKVDKVDIRQELGRWVPHMTSKETAMARCVLALQRRVKHLEELVGA